MQETGQESNVYEKLHILPLERKSMFRDLKMYLVKETNEKRAYFKADGKRN